MLRVAKTTIVLLKKRGLKDKQQLVVLDVSNMKQSIILTTTN